MLSRHRNLVVGVFLSLLAVAVTAVLVIAAPVVMPTVGIIPTAHQPGAPAIQPTISGVTPSYTVQDAIDYVNTHGTLWTTPGQVTATSAEVMTAAESIKKSQGSLVDSDATRLVCLVTVRGSYTLNGAPDDQGKNTGATFSGAYLTFDATTGHVLQQTAIK